MPIYEYQCQSCDHVLERLQKISDAPLVDCPSCGKPTLKKFVTAGAFRLSGGGWYETDFKTGNKKNLAGDAGKTGGKSESQAGASKAGDSGSAGSNGASGSKKSSEKSSGAAKAKAD